MRDWFRQWDVTELFHACQARRIPAAPVNRMADIFTDRHLRERNFFAPLPLSDRGHHLEVPSVPFKASDMGWRLERPAPRLGEHNDQTSLMGRVCKDSATPLEATRLLRSEPSLVPSTAGHAHLASPATERERDKQERRGA
jgi:crotonobetainyl-CoA:carnitine CoA-transferase CaiB-like acyl-CoA transferase